MGVQSGGLSRGKRGIHCINALLLWVILRRLGMPGACCLCDFCAAPGTGRIGGVDNGAEECFDGVFRAIDGIVLGGICFREQKPTQGDFTVCRFFAFFVHWRCLAKQRHALFLPLCINTVAQRFAYYGEASAGNCAIHHHRFGTGLLVIWRELRLGTGFLNLGLRTADK